MTQTDGGDVSREPDADDPPGAPPSGADDVTAGLAREVYWAGDGAPRLPTSRLARRATGCVHASLRVDQRQLVPAESLLGSASGLKRRIKLFTWRLTRFSTMRYDRLLADLSEMNGELARRLLETEEELARLREDLDRRGGTAS